MKTALFLSAAVALAESTSALNSTFSGYGGSLTPCHQQQYYCGKTLRSSLGYNPMQLVDAVVSSTPTFDFAASPEVDNSLFFCVNDANAEGYVSHTGVCEYGCESTTSGDSCVKPAFASTSRGLVAQASTSDIWAGANNYFLHAFQDADRNAVLDAMRDANLKVVRIFVSNVDQNNKGTGSAAVPDVEVGSPGTWNDAILNRIDQLMVEVNKRGMKLIITMHDRWMLGHWGSDVYVSKYGLKGDDVTSFYSNANAAADMDRRFAHILTHKNPYFSNRAWGDLDEVILSVGIENESQGAVSSPNFKWVCDRAKNLRQYITKKTILVSSGGGREIDTSLNSDFMNCDALDILGVHFYGASAYDIRRYLYDAVVANKKRVYVEEFGGIGNSKADDIRSQIAAIKAAGVPWMVWEVSKPGKGSGDYEVWTDEPTWQVLKSEASAPKQQVQAWPEMGSNSTVATPSKPDGVGVRGDWDFCAASSECANGCCSSEYSNDGKLKCTPGGTPSKCVSSGSGGAGWLGDWEFCDSNSVCRNGCCSNEYSNDGRLKCTPGGSLALCGVGNGLKNDWNFCSSSAECANGCCSKQYSNDGKLKCTPGGARDQCVGSGVLGAKKDWDFCTTSTDCSNGCCSKEYSDDGKLKCTPGGSRALCVGASTVNGKKMDWEFCSSGSECANGCCSKEFSNDGKLKCTPGGSRDKCLLKGDWEACQSNNECANACCSKQYSGDGKYKCTPGGSKDQCVNGFGGGSALLGDWAFCSTSGECLNQCCSTEYSGDGKKKCTPGGTKSKCEGFGFSSNSGKGDWATCSTNAECTNGCCSGQYSSGILKCTPGGSKDQCVGAKPQLGGDWSFCSDSGQCTNGCCSKQYSGDGLLKCTPGGDKSQCVGVVTSQGSTGSQNIAMQAFFSKESVKIGTQHPRDVLTMPMWNHLNDNFLATGMSIADWGFSYLQSLTDSRRPSCTATLSGNYYKWDYNGVNIDGWLFRDMYVNSMLLALDKYVSSNQALEFYTDSVCVYNPRTDSDHCHFVGDKVRVYEVPRLIRLRFVSSQPFQDTDMTLEVKCVGDEVKQKDACGDIATAMSFLMAVPLSLTGVIGNFVNGACDVISGIINS